MADVNDCEHDWCPMKASVERSTVMIELICNRCNVKGVHNLDATELDLVDVELN